MPNNSAIGRARRTVGMILAGATLSAGAITAGMLAATTIQTTIQPESRQASTDDDSDQGSVQVANPGLTNTAPQTSTRGS